MKNTAPTEQEIEGILTQAYNSRINDLPQSITLAQHAIALSADSNPRLYASALNQLALFLMIKGEFKQAVELSEKALNFFEKVNDLKGIADAKYNIASACYKTDNFHTGLSSLLDCYQLYRQLDDYHNQARVLKSIGTIYEYFGDLTNAVESYHRCIEAAEKVNDLNQVSNAYNPLSGIYVKQGKAEEALSIVQKSIAIKEQTKDTRGHAYALYARGKVFLKLQQYSHALTDFKRALTIHCEMGEKVGEAMALNKLGFTHMAMKQYDEAEKELTEAIKLTEKHSVQVIRFKAHYNLYLLFSKKNDSTKALKYLEEYIRLKEKVINTHTYNIIKSYESIKKIELLEQEARRQRDKAEIIERKNAELDSFFYRISHDLKGPISSLLGLHNLVKLEIKEETALHYFGMYNSQIQRINNIVVDLINLTRMNHSAETKSKIDFRLMVNGCIAAYHYLENFRTIEFVVTIQDNLNYHAEWAIVNTILQNLIENSIKYARTDATPQVRISVTETDGMIRIQVEDNGQGIREEDQQKIFNMFFRGTDRVQGTGLGLYILKRAVERLNGEIELKSQVNTGSAFTIILPRIQVGSEHM